MTKFISGTIDRFENDHAVVILENQQTLTWPKNKLTDDVRPGQAVHLFLTTDDEETAVREQQAADVLNEILNNNEKTL